MRRGPGSTAWPLAAPFAFVGRVLTRRSPRHRAMAGHGGSRPALLESGVFLLADAVAHLGGFLELQVAGVLVHLLLQLGELRRQLARRQRGVVLDLLRHLLSLAPA